MAVGFCSNLLLLTLVGGIEDDDDASSLESLSLSLSLSFALDFPPTPTPTSIHHWPLERYNCLLVAAGIIALDVSKEVFTYFA